MPTACHWRSMDGANLSPLRSALSAIPPLMKKQVDGGAGGMVAWSRSMSEIESNPGNPRADRMDAARLAEQWRALAAGEEDPVALMATFAALVFHADARISFAGFYRILAGGGLVIGPYQGPVGCLRIAPGRGVCGAAAASGEAVLVPDVHAFPGHIACDPRARSELVLPVRDRAGALIAVFDLDSTRPEAFDDEDVRVLGSLLDRFPVRAEGSAMT